MSLQRSSAIQRLNFSFCPLEPWRLHTGLTSVFTLWSLGGRIQASLDCTSLGHLKGSCFFDSTKSAFICQWDLSICPCDSSRCIIFKTSFNFDSMTMMLPLVPGFLKGPCILPGLLCFILCPNPG
ncbi:uncharacterized protein LOC102701712 [Oryza brachyantha]|uniref:uncharacterized protein LOC102701712 n=1 Tax=Oryza brachyantha TaxID=4533 RepID=UPI001ADC653E|nr:uncharacterized protein LOC102701712 [Oryza brachyantha]